jgi:sulfite oxidase
MMLSLDFSNEPKDRTKSLHVHQAEPFNAEPEDLAEFIQHHITPSHLVYGRNHGPIPDINESSYKLTVNGLVNQPIQLSLSDLKRMPKVDIVAAIQVRRKENPLTLVCW